MMAFPMLLACVYGVIPTRIGQICEPTLSSELVTSDLESAVFLTSPPDDHDRLFVVELRGRIRIVKNGVLLVEPFLDLTDRVVSGAERGLFSMAFHPRYAENGYSYVFYTSPDLVIARYRVSDDEDRADPNSAVTLLTIPHPAWNHNGGQLQFSPLDGYLYIGTGDGADGSASQDPTSLLGKMLRLDVDADPPYLPLDNPFIGEDGVHDEIWAFGLRNPWRFSFDRLTGDLWIADVGASRREEINFQPAHSTGGENYGWPCLEGSQPAYTCQPFAFNFVLPISEYTHEQGCAVIGASVYRGSAIPHLNGAYFYADYCSGFLRTLRFDGVRAYDLKDLTHEASASGGCTFSCLGFGEDAGGELYCCAANGVYKLIPPADVVSADFVTTDCNENCVPDDCDLRHRNSRDCNTNLIPDECDVATGSSLDCNANLVPDECNLASRDSLDCQRNGIPDECDIASGGSDDCDRNFVPDECAEQGDRISAVVSRRNDFFGTAVAISGEWAFVGIPDTYFSSVDTTGRVHVFRRIENRWAMAAILRPPGLANPANFGGSICLSGDHAIIGASYDNTMDTLNTGAAYTYRRNGFDWAFEQKLVVTGTSNGDQVGSSVALDGNVAVLSAPGTDTDDGYNTGVAYIFRYDGTLWHYASTLTAADAVEAMSFGSPVAVYDDTIVVGAPLADNGYGRGSGSVYPFRRIEGRWLAEPKLTASQPASEDFFGRGLALDGAWLMVGAPLDDDFGQTGSGTVYVFLRSGGAWNIHSTLHAPTPSPRNEFGVAIALQSGNAVISSPKKSYPGFTEAGQVSVFSFGSSGWVTSETVSAGTPDMYAQFGYAVGISGNRLIAGAPYEDTPLITGVGAAYIFFLGGVDCNSNGQNDYCDVRDAVSRDCDGSERPDECESFGPGDFVRDGQLDLRDIAALQRCFSGKASCAPCCRVFDMTTADGDVDGQDFSQLWELFANGGPR